MYQGYNFVNGVRFRDTSHHVFEAVNPSTEEVYGTFHKTPWWGVADAIAIARKVQPGWARQSRVNRAEYFDALAQLIKRDHDKLRDAISIETGKNLNESHAEVIEALHMCQVAASMGRQPYGEVVASELATKDAYVVRKPRGVVGIISPWNFPLAIGSFWCAAPSLVEGNTVVHKPSELTPMVNDLAARLYSEAGFPAGVFNLVHGDGNTGAALAGGDVDVILFTGSASVGQSIRRTCANSFTKTCSIECGSKSATMVFADGDLELAVEAAFASAFKLTGQRCVSTSRILVERSVLPRFKELFMQRVNALTIGDPFSKLAPFCGPLISQSHKDRVANFVDLIWADTNAKTLTNKNSFVPGVSKGHFMNPVVYECEWADKPFLKQEIFGPVVGIIPFNNLDDAIRIYNDTEYGLALGAVTNDFRKHRELAQRCTTGMLYINGGSIAAESHLPFGGINKSGNFTKSAAGTYKSVTSEIVVTVNYEEGKISWAQGMK